MERVCLCAEQSAEIHRPARAVCHGRQSVRRIRRTCYDGEEYYCWQLSGCTSHFAMSEFQAEAYANHAARMDIYFTQVSAGFESQPNGDMKLLKYSTDTSTVTTQEGNFRAVSGGGALTNLSSASQFRIDPASLPKDCDKKCLERIVAMTPMPVGAPIFAPGQAAALAQLFGQGVKGAEALLAKLHLGEQVSLGGVTWATLNETRLGRSRTSSTSPEPERTT